jgi:hypothetical protein
MADFSVRSDSVNVEQIMEQIRARIREKRGVDYTEQQIRELAAVKLEKFLDPRGVRSDLLEQFRKAQPAYEPPELPNFAFEDATLFESHRAPIRWLRALLLPILKLFFNPNPLIQALHIQSRLNTMNAEREARREAARRQLDQLYYELIHNLVLETTRLGIDVKNLKMRLESVSSRLEFNERRARALESVVVYKPGGADERPPRQERADRSDRADRGDRSARQQQQQPPPQRQYVPPPSSLPISGSAPSAVAALADTAGAPPVATQVPASPTAAAPTGEGPGQRSRRRRRRRGRRAGGSAAALIGAPASPGGQPADTSADPSTLGSGDASEPFDDGTDEGPDDDQNAEPLPAPRTADAAPAPADESRSVAHQPPAPAASETPGDESQRPPAAPGHGDSDPQ